MFTTFDTRRSAVRTNGLTGGERVTQKNGVSFCRLPKRLLRQQRYSQAVIEEADRTRNVLENTLKLITSLIERDTLLIQTPIFFTKDYSELVEPVGILKAIKDVKAFCSGTPGAEIIPAFQRWGDRIVTVEGKRGLNAFSNTRLDQILEDESIENVVLAGAVTSICIDSTGRAAHERGYRVTVLSDCTASRTRTEQDFYCEHIFPLYAQVKSSEDFVEELKRN